MPNFDLQMAYTGSEQIWSDIVIKDFTRTNNGKIVTFDQWPEFLGFEHWDEIVNYNSDWDDNFNVLSRLMTKTVLHKLMHSHIVPNPSSISPLLIYFAFCLDIDANGRI